MRAASQQLASRVLADLQGDGSNLLASIERLSRPDDCKRTWLQLADTKSFDAWLIAWSRGSDIHAHDHGDSAGALLVVRGSLVELYRDPGPWERTRAARWVARELSAGTSVEVPRHRIHHIANQGPDVAVSIHVYSPPLSGLTFHDDLAARTATAVGANPQ